tara:strand:+ start:368 stop:706 length:339 start_codon:yes stop_codon:yes gene_type:complete
MRNSNDRMPKKDYFKMRYDNAVANGNEDKAKYYKDRLAQLDDTTNPLLEYVNDELSKLDRGIVATPKTDIALEQFAKANHGCNDFLLMQMSKNYGYKLAMEEIKDRLTDEFK